MVGLSRVRGSSGFTAIQELGLFGLGPFRRVGVLAVVKRCVMRNSVLRKRCVTLSLSVS